MFVFVVLFLAIIGLVNAAGPAPPKPTWPLEFITQAEFINLNDNSTRHFHWQYSHSMNAEATEGIAPGRELYADVMLYNKGHQYILFGCDRSNLQCQMRPLQGKQLLVPPVNTFKFVGEKMHRGHAVDHWQGTIGADNFDYFNLRANDQPLALFDHSQKAGFFFPPETFHRHTFTPQDFKVPSACSN